ncbi:MULTISPECIES: ferric reductase-like transmembrane domain-containing protein [unclassified Fusibacter]|uniref:ferredoxin reductase family protein n=1 Tax=unclassified Fusibacter TaxID=2624464 RepID=UPI001010BF9B|nr:MULTISPECIES: ferric reductase-like transmembrane domain-containing protein [unclassified Fusibacter]MCK8058684.1 FAD-binding oxidoreductase [Fusibacter sp. A2]NPE21759.1 hypothetical protein [Fusibacter sp. A1]RXV61333.1 hypothetical protein DWB64_07930 [Fusibacter sp. A1]
MKKTVIALLYLLSPFLLVFTIGHSSPIKYASIGRALPMVVGVVGYTWLLWQFVLSARPKFIEKHFGLDKMYRLHGVVAVVALCLVLVHKTVNENLYGETIVTSLESVAFTLFAGVSAISMMFMWTSVFSKFEILQKVIKGVSSIKAFAYERLKLIHNLTIVGMVFMQIHVLMSSSASSSRLIFDLYMLYFFIAVGSYLYHKCIKPWLLEKRLYEISDLKKESEDILTIVIRPKSGSSMEYQPGQFGYFTLMSDRMPLEEHPFSISSSPSDGSELSITVKELGDFTRSTSNLKIGDRVKVEGPYGKFSYLRYKNEASSIFIAGGIGITPVLGMIDQISCTNRMRPVLLIWAVRSGSDLIRYEWLKKLQTVMPNFVFVPVVSSDRNWTGRSGRLNYDVVKNILAEVDFIDERTGYYVCASPNLTDNVRQYLKKLGTSKKQIHYEKFTV